MYHLIAFYQRIVELWCHAKNFPKAPRKVLYALHWSIGSGMFIYLLIPRLIIWHFPQLDKFSLFKAANTCLNHLILNHLLALNGSYLSLQKQCSVNFGKQFKIWVSIAVYKWHQSCSQSRAISFIRLSVLLPCHDTLQHTRQRYQYVMRL